MSDDLRVPLIVDAESTLGDVLLDIIVRHHKAIELLAWMKLGRPEALER